MRRHRIKKNDYKEKVMMALGVSLRMAIVSDHAYITTLVVMPNIIYEKTIFFWFLFPKTQSILLCMRNQLKRIFLKWDHLSLTPESKSPKEWTHFLKEHRLAICSLWSSKILKDSSITYILYIFKNLFFGVFSSLHPKIIFD